MPVGKGVGGLGALLQEIHTSSKYRTVCEEVIRNIGQKELSKRRNRKEAVKETKNTLHQIAGAYLDHKPNYAEMLSLLNAASASEDPNVFRATCRQAMQNHASARERLPFLEEFYGTVMGGIGPITSLLDVASGLNPLAIPWMPLAPHAVYHACDLYTDMMAFLESFFPLAGIMGTTVACDVLTSPPTQAVDVALVLKVLPPLEQLDKAAGLRLLKALEAQYLLVSFPTRTLGGRNKRMAENYEAHFREMIQGEPWEVERFLFETELCFRVRVTLTEGVRP